MGLEELLRFETELFRFYDIAALIRSASGLGWDAVARTASNWEVIRPVRWALDRIETFWPGLIPSSTRQGLAQLRPNRRRQGDGHEHPKRFCISHGILIEPSVWRANET